MPLKPPVSAADHFQGNPDAPIELLQYGDYQCPYCGQAYPIIKKIQEVLGDRLKFVFRNFPLAELHPQAKLAAAAAEAAARQDKFWQMHDMLYENQKRLNMNSLLGYAQDLLMDVDAFKADMADEEITKKVDDDFYSGVRSGVNGTPTFFINGEKYAGTWDYEEFVEYLQQLSSAD